MSFLDEFRHHTWEQMGERIYTKREQDVMRALHKQGRRDLDDFCALISRLPIPT